MTAHIAAFSVDEYTDIETSVNLSGEAHAIAMAPDHFDIEATVVGAANRREALEALQAKLFRELQG